MEFGDFKTYVADFMQRDKSLFSSPPSGAQVDVLAAAINQSKNWAQKMRRFEYTKSVADLTINKTTGGDLANAVLHGTATAVPVRSIERAYVPSTDNANVIYPIDIVSREEHIRRVQREVERIDPYYRQGDYPLPSLYCNFALHQHGKILYIYPWDDTLLGTSNVKATLDIYIWYPDYVDDTDEDFFLIEGLDWMLYKTVFHLNAYLKDDQRLPVNAEIIKDAWDAFVAWDETITRYSGPVTLD